MKLFFEKKYAITFRIVFLLAAVYFLEEIYSSFSSGVIVDGRRVVELSEDSFSFYSMMFKKMAFAGVFLFLTFFGVNRKESNETNDKK